MRAPTARPVTVGGKRLRPPRHICCFFDSKQQQYEVLIPYINEGIANGEKVMTIMDREALDDHHRRLDAGGVATATAQESGHLCSLCSDDTYLAGGAFSKVRMHRLLEAELAAVAKSPFVGLRTCGDMSWALRNMPGTDELLEYESEVNALLDHHDATFMCVYDANRISGRAMLDILGTHSHVLIGSTVHENQYYMKPADYRRTIIARRAAATDPSKMWADEPARAK